MDDNARNIDISALIQQAGQGSMDDFGLDDMDKLESWCGPIEGILRARALSAMVNANSSHDLIASAAQSIASMEQWRDLLADLLRNSEIAPATIDVAHQVLRQIMPTHPLSTLPTAPTRACAVYDAIGEGERLTFILDDLPKQGGEWIFFDLADPIDLVAPASVTIENGSASVRLDELAWIDPHRVACPAFAVVIA